MENLREITTGRINFVKLVDVAKYNKGRVLFNPGWVIRYENCLNVKKTAQKHALVCKIKF